MFPIEIPGKEQYENIIVIHKQSISQRPEERSVQLAVRIHRTLELADDKFYVITCGKAGATRDDSGAHTVLKFFEPGTERRVRETVYGRPYTIRVELAQPNGTIDALRVTNCVAFNKKNGNITLIDERGCPVGREIITRFTGTGNMASAQLASMFKFPDGSEVHLQCDVAACMAGRCAAESAIDCDKNVVQAGVATKGGSGGALGRPAENNVLSATTVFVLDPSEAPSEYRGSGVMGT